MNRSVWSFREAVAYLSGLEGRGWRLGLDRMEEFLRRAGLQDAVGAPGGPQYIHVAGTNGKGSVTATVERLLAATGYRTGAFFSPFVYDFRERVQCCGEVISEEELARIAWQIRPAAQALESTPFGGPTEFEFKTALGFALWREREVEWVALEVGMGGRLDATNVVLPRACAIVSIGLDHTQHLGVTLREIAREKAGIIKRGVPCVVGSLPSEAMRAVESVAGERGSELWRFGEEIHALLEGDSWTLKTPAGAVDGVRPALIGPMQPHNAALALAAVQAAGIDVRPRAVREAIASTSLPGRFERRRFCDAEFVLDGAHNADAAEALAEAMRTAYPGEDWILLTGMVSGHDPRAFYSKLASGVASAEVAPIDFHRAVPPGEIAGVLDALGIASRAHATAGDALDAAIEASGGRRPVLVTGSFYLVGEIGNLMTARQEKRAPSPAG